MNSLQPGLCLITLLALPGAVLGQVLPKAGGQDQGLQLFARGQYREAAQVLERASAQAPNDPELARALGLCYLRLRNPAGARAAFARLFRVPPDSGKAHLLAAKMMMVEEFEEMAEPELHSALKLDPKLPEIHFLMAEIAISRGDTDRGIAELQEEIALNPAFSMAYYRLGDAYSRKNLWDRAVAPLEQSIWLNPFFSSPYILLGKAYYHLERLEFAEGMLKKALSMDPNNAGAHYLLANVYRDMGRQEDSRKEIELWRKTNQK
ncbi:MAG: tetratricopeptide repeat protein [Bryobacteraceae bacterium]